MASRRTEERDMEGNCTRAVEYNCSLAKTSRQEAEELFDAMFNLKQALSGRTLWVGGTEVAEKYPLSNFNCFRRDTEFLTKEGIKTFMILRMEI